VAGIAQRLRKARIEIEGYREDLRKGVDPIETKKIEQQRARQALQMNQAAAKKERTTLARVAREYRERHRHLLETSIHRERICQP
jgi:hypothetical protein